MDNCANKFIRSNHRIMEVFMEVQATIVQKRVDEMNAQAALIDAQNQTENISEVSQWFNDT